MFTLITSDEFDAWIGSLKDPKAKARILARLQSARHGNFGDCKPVGDGICEMRVHVGAGYRVYYARAGATIYLILNGGDKASQKKDIARAKKLFAAFKVEETT